MYIYSICCYCLNIPLPQADAELEISPVYCSKQWGIEPQNSFEAVLSSKMSSSGYYFQTKTKISAIACNARDGCHEKHSTL